MPFNKFNGILKVLVCLSFCQLFNNSQFFAKENAMKPFTPSLAAKAYLLQRDGGGGAIGGGGGAGISVSRQLAQTFYSAGFLPTEICEKSIPGLEELIHFVSMNMDYLEPSIKQALLKSLLISNSRKYIKLNDVNEKTLTSFKQKFVKATGFSFEKNFSLFAITDPDLGVTYLLPSFFKLRKKTEQMAILFHEAYWIQNRFASYQQVIDLEKSFQALLEAWHETEQNAEAHFQYKSEAEYEITMNFVKKYAGPLSQLRLALGYDFQRNENLNQINLNLRFRFIEARDLFNSDFFMCSGGSVCLLDQLPGLIKLLNNENSNFYHSAVLKFMIEKIQMGKIEFVSYEEKVSGKTEAVIAYMKEADVLQFPVMTTLPMIPFCADGDFGCRNVILFK